jgi:hypothetical protein
VIRRFAETIDTLALRIETAIDAGATTADNNLAAEALPAA